LASAVSADDDSCDGDASFFLTASAAWAGIASMNMLTIPTNQSHPILLLYVVGVVVGVVGVVVVVVLVVVCEQR
jgi:hypothetical protein